MRKDHVPYERRIFIHKHWKINHIELSKGLIICYIMLLTNKQKSYKSIFRFCFRLTRRWARARNPGACVSACRGPRSPRLDKMWRPHPTPTITTTPTTTIISQMGGGEPSVEVACSLNKWYTASPGSTAPYVPGPYPPQFIISYNPIIMEPLCCWFAHARIFLAAQLGTLAVTAGSAVDTGWRD